MVYHNQNQAVGVGAAANPVGAALGFGIIAAFASSFFASLFLGGFALLFLVFVGFAVSDINKHTGRRRSETVLEKAALTCLIGSALAVVLGTIPVFWFHWLSFSLVGWITTALFLGSLVLGLVSRLSALLRLIAVLLAGTMVADLTVLPEPTSAAGPGDHSKDWSATLTVRDASGNPIPRALANCTSVMSWFASQRPRELIVGYGQFTDENGEAEFRFHEDRRLKLVFCMAFKPATSNEYDGMQEGGYAPEFSAGATPTPLLSAPVEIRLTSPTPVDSNCDIDEAYSRRKPCSTMSQNNYFFTTDDH